MAYLFDVFWLDMLLPHNAWLIIGAPGNSGQKFLMKTSTTLKTLAGCILWGSNSSARVACVQFIWLKNKNKMKEIKKKTNFFNINCPSSQQDIEMLVKPLRSVRWYFADFKVSLKKKKTFKSIWLRLVLAYARLFRFVLLHFTSFQFNSFHFISHFIP